MATDDAFPLPRGWTKTVRSSVLHAISVAFMALTRAWGSSATSRRRTTRLQADLDRATTEIALLSEELAIKDARFRRVPPRRRPHYGPTQRMRILQLKAARGWPSAQAARVFAVTEETIASDPYSEDAPLRNPAQGRENHTRKVIRGGGWAGPAGQSAFNTRTTRRLWSNPSYWHDNVGFRCVKDRSSWCHR